MFQYILNKLYNNSVKKNIRFRVLGKTNELPETTQTAIKNALQKTKKCDGLIFNIALNYGGRDEIVRAVKKLEENFENGSPCCQNNTFCIRQNFHRRHPRIKTP